MLIRLMPVPLSETLSGMFLMMQRHYLGEQFWCGNAPRIDKAFAAPLMLGMDAGAAPPYTLEKLVMDLHTGKFFFGKTREWIWIDLVGGAMVLLGVTGIVIWRRSEKAKAHQAEARL